MDTPDAVALRSILAGLGYPSAVAIRPLAGGSAAVFRLDLEDGTSLTLKSFPSADSTPQREAYAASLLAATGVPVPRFLLIDDSQTRLTFPFALTTHLDGRPASRFAAHPAYGDVFAQIGRLSRRMHTVDLPAFGQLPEPVFATNTEYLRQLSDHTIDRFRHYGADAALADKLREVMKRDFDAVVPPSTRAVFAHDDLHPNNILVREEEDGTLAISGLIDFGNARASASVMDLAKTIFCCEHDAPGSTKEILAGYGAIDHSSPSLALAYYTLFHRMTMWFWLRHIGIIAAPDAPSDIMDALKVTAAGAQRGAR